MKRLILLILVLILMPPLIPIAVAEENVPYSIMVDFIFRNPFTYDGEYVTESIPNTGDQVRRPDGTEVISLQSGYSIWNERRLGDYILVSARTDDGDYGCTAYDLNGQQVLDSFYDEVLISGSVAIVGVGEWKPPGYLRGKKGACDLKTGEMILPIEYANLEFMLDGKYILATTYESTVQRRVFDLKGREVTDETGFYEEYVPPSSWRAWDEHLTIVRSIQTNLAGLMDKSGAFVLPMEYENFGACAEEMVFAKKNGKYGVVSLKGEVIIPFEYTNGGLYYNGVADMWNESGVTVYDCSNGLAQTIASPGIYSGIAGVCGEITYVNRAQDGAVGGIAKTGEVVIPFMEKMQAVYFNENFIVFWSIADYEYGEDFSWRYPTAVLNSAGEFILPPGQFDVSVNPTRYGYLEVWDKAAEESLYYDRAGRLIARGRDNIRGINLQTGYLIRYDEQTKSFFMTGLDGETVIAKGKFEELWFIDGINAVYANINGKYGVISLPEYVSTPSD